MHEKLLLAALALAAASTSHAQVTRYIGPSPNLTVALDFDTPFVASGPIASTDPAFTGAGISSVNLIGAGFTAAGDTMTAASNVMGQGLVSQGGVLSIAGPGEPLDNLGAGDGFEVVLANPFDEFQVLFVDQVNMNYDVELLSGSTSLGSGSFNYAGGFPNPPHYWRGTAPFDTVRITFPGGSGGVGLDEFAFGNGPAPQPPTNDDCAMAQVATLGANAFDTNLATASAAVTSCATGGQDVWFEYTAANGNGLLFDTCGSGFDTVLEVYTGTCGALVSVGCDDDGCGLQSQVFVANVTAGTTYLVQVDGFNAAAGTGALNITEVPPPANDECTGATTASLGANAFDTLGATTSAGMFSCGTGEADVWFEYTSMTAPPALLFSTCGTALDTLVEVYTGDCNTLVSAGCSDDSCGLQSEVTVTPVAAGTTYFVRVGGAPGAAGPGSLTISEITPPPPLTSNCVETLFMSNNGGATGGAVYFDVTSTLNVSISGILTNTSAMAGSPIGLSVYTTPMTSVGNETNAAAWTLVAEDDGTAVSAGDDNQTVVNFLAPFMLPAGTTGIALVGNNQTTGLTMDHDYTNGTGTNQNYASQDGVLSLSLGTASNVPFTGNVFSPRVWNGRMCHGMATPGMNFCMANLNSTGVAASMSASGTADIAANDLVLETSDLPLNAFGYFLASQTQGFTPNPAGSMGNLCLGGQIGRFVGAGQIQSSGATGMISLALDNTQVPTPSALVAVMPGEAWSFQSWFRDAVGGSATSNFSDGLEVTFN